MNTIQQSAKDGLPFPIPHIPKQLFQPGALFITPGVIIEMAVRYDEDEVDGAYMTWLARHLTGEHQFEPESGAEAPVVSAEFNARGGLAGVAVFSQFQFRALHREDDIKVVPPPVWVITNAARSLTTILLPTELRDEFK